MTDCDKPSVERRECAQRVAIADTKIAGLQKTIEDLETTLKSLDSKYVRIERYRLIELAVIAAIGFFVSRGYLNDVEPKVQPAPPPPVAKQPSIPSP